MDLSTIVFGEVTLGQCLYTAGGIVAGLFVLAVIKKLVFPPKASLQHSVAFTCANCGWRGHIGKYAHNCPKCSQPVK